MEAWPPARIRIKSPRLELRLPSEDELVELADLSHGRLLKPGQERFFKSDWWAADQPEYTHNLLRHNAELKATWDVNRWTLFMVPFLNGDPIGQVSLRAVDFPRSRSLATGSWILPEYRGNRFAREMRAALISFGFRNLNAVEFVTSIHSTNQPSIRTTVSLGYIPNGTFTRHEPGDIYRFRMFREQWLDDIPVTVSGFESCKEFFL